MNCMAKKSKSKSSKNKSQTKKKTRKVEPIPKGFRTVTPYLTIDSNASEALDWYKKAFGAKELARQTTPDGKIMHARMRIGDSIVMLSDNLRGSQTSTRNANPKVALHIYAKNVDKLWQQAVDAGAKVNMPIDNQFWGERYGQLSDPYGHTWSLSQQVAMSREEMKEKQEQAMSSFSQGGSSAESEEMSGQPQEASMMSQE